MNHLHNAIRKCSHQYKRNWGGYLLPEEILALRDIGAITEKHYIDIAIDRKQNGRCTGSWTYFNANIKFNVLREGMKIKPQ